MIDIQRSKKLLNVCYDIRGKVLQTAQKMEEEGHHLIKLNIGNPAPFGFEMPEEIVQDMMRQLSNATGYSDSKGLYSARKAIMQDYQSRGVMQAHLDQIYLGNGVSELIVAAVQALLNDQDEVLIPSPDYPLWTAAVSLAGGKPVHYLCDEQADWCPDVADMAKKITSRTKAIVLINPNNPTGACYPKAVLEDILRLAQTHKLLIFADEIYDKILYDDTVHVPLASISGDWPVISFSGLSKTYRAAGIRSGWLLYTGNLSWVKDFIEGLNILTSMRLCANVPAQYAIQTALGGYQSIKELTAPSGRLCRQRDLAHQLLTDIPGITCVKPQAALYLFPKIDLNRYPVSNDEDLIYQILRKEKVLLVQGSAFNWSNPDHFRFVFLPHEEDIREAGKRLHDFFTKSFEQC
jgi:alanine-synthesizing transaminase